MVMKAVTTQAPISRAGESTSRAISADTRKIPDPIIDPITSMVELVRPRPLMNSRSSPPRADACAGIAFASTLNRLPLRFLSFRAHEIRSLADESLVEEPAFQSLPSQLSVVLLSISGGRAAIPGLSIFAQDKLGAPGLHGLYPRMRKNSSTDLPGSRMRSDITATE